MTVEERYEALAQDASVSTVNSFGKSMPTEFSTENMLNVGDYLVFPAQMPEIKHRVFGKDRTGKDVFGEFIVIEKVSVDGVKTAFEFYPSMLTKNFWPAKKNENGEVEMEGEGPLNPKGTAVTKYLEFRGKGTTEKTDTQLAMESFLSHKIKISAKKPLNTQRWSNGQPLNQLKQVGLPTYDFEA